MICYFYAKKFERAIEALDAPLHPPKYKMVYTGDSLTAYGEAIHARWNGTQELIGVEQDIVVNDLILGSLEDCRHDWCVAPYYYRLYDYVADACNEPLMIGSLGCFRVSANAQRIVTREFMLANPDGIRVRNECRGCTDAMYCWRHVDHSIQTAFAHHEINVHVHPYVLEHIGHG